MAATKDEKYWNDKHPTLDQMYRGRPLPNNTDYEIDVRHFIWFDDIVLKALVTSHELHSDSNDETALLVQQFVRKYLKYESDTMLGASEYWLFPAESYAMKIGDCEDGAILMASLLLNALPVEHHWRVRVAAGFVQSDGSEGGHAYVTYCRCSDNEWVILDWCYYPDEAIAVAKKPMAKDVPMYKEIWFSFNHLHAWSHKDFALEGRLRDI